jgi:DNA-binding winged helix-turn-helix (wHTH) protein
MRVYFEEFEFDQGRRVLEKASVAIHLSPKAFVLLGVLIENAPNAMTKEELYSHVWGNTFVEEANLPNLISEIRAALGERRREARFIKTVHGYGYAFNGKIISGEAPRTPVVCPSIFSLFYRREEFPLRLGSNIIGRAADADVVIDSAAVSRQHARIEVTGTGAVLIEDLGSKNGTFVGEQRVTLPVELRDGDELRVGVVSMTFHAREREGSTVTQMES